MRAGLLLALLPAAAASLLNASAACPITATTQVAVYTDVAGGVGAGSANWERNFWAWWRALDARVEWVELAAADVAARCDLAAFAGLRLYAQPGGNAYDEQLGVTPAGTANIRRFLDARASARYLGTCAGWYFAATDYWWQGVHYDAAAEPNLLGRFDATVEGSITDLADYDGSPPYAVAGLDNGLEALYYGGPTRGWRTRVTTRRSGS